MYRETLVFCVLLAVVSATVEMRELEKKPDKYKGVNCCYVSALQDCIPVGQTRPFKNECKGWTCNKDNLLEVSCGEVLVEHYVKDKTAPFPHCCPIAQA
nr:venom protein U-MPTX.1-Mc1 [Megalopyge crispata]